MLPRVRELEERFGDALVVVGVHAGKYTAERRTASIAEACLRLGVHHPVLNDRQFRTWRAYAVQAWPTLAFVDPKGYLVASQAGELPLEALEGLLERLLEGHQAEGALRRGAFDLARPPAPQDTGTLRFPGKLLCAADRLYVSDTGHHQILELALESGPRGRILRRIGSGAPFFADGSAERAAFREPQGLALGDGLLFVADRANHAIREVRLDSGHVRTLAGTGELGSRPRPGPGRETALRSPWDLWLQERRLYIAMAGSHQIWRLDLATEELRVHAGSGAEAIDDGPLARATLAQPSGLTAAGGRLYFADAESSSIRWADLREDGRVGTIVGTGLFEFGDRDGEGEDVRLQHPLAVAWHDGQLLVADSYNGKLKRVDPVGRKSRTWPEDLRVGTGSARALDPARRVGLALNEPGGLAIDGSFLYVADTGNHRIVRVNVTTGEPEVLTLLPG